MHFIENIMFSLVPAVRSKCMKEKSTNKLYLSADFVYIYLLITIEDIFCVWKKLDLKVKHFLNKRFYAKTFYEYILAPFVMCNDFICNIIKKFIVIVLIQMQCYSYKNLKSVLILNRRNFQMYFDNNNYYSLLVLFSLKNILIYFSLVFIIKNGNETKTCTVYLTFIFISIKHFEPTS